MNLVLKQLWALARDRPVVSLCLLVTLVLGAANYRLWRERAVVTRRHDEVWHKGVATLHLLMDRQRITADLARLRSALEVIDENLSVETDMEMNLGYFYRLEKFTRVHLRQLSQLNSPPSPEGNPFKTVPISLRATGTYDQLMNFIRALETGPRILAIRGFRFSRSDPKSSAMSLELSVDMLASR